MFYCAECATENSWPSTAPFFSRGKCEMCHSFALCNDLPSGLLPEPGEAPPTQGQIDAAIKSITGGQA